MNPDNKKLVAVVVPLSNRAKLTPEEEISKRQLLHFLKRYDIYALVPESLQYNFEDFINLKISDNYFGSVAAHNKLLLSPFFYNLFSSYEYILIYHLDSLVFEDKLEYWCSQGFDYVAPPWISHPDAPYLGNAAYEGKVGNGGFSLRKVDSFKNIFKSRVRWLTPTEYWNIYCHDKSFATRLRHFPLMILKNSLLRNNARWEMAHFSLNEERFIANRVQHYCPNFKIADISTALKFAFECVPRYCYEKNSFNLPFGCHAWHQYDRPFWEQFLL